MYLSSVTLRFVLSATLLAAGGCLSLGAQEAFLATVAPAGSSHLSLASAADSVIVFSAAGSSRTVGLLTNLWPQAQSDADWCTTGVSATALDLAVAANAAAAVRTAAVQLVAKDGHRATLRLRQLGTSPAIVTREETVRLTNNDTALSLFVVSNVPHDISLPAWIHLRRKVAEAGGTRYDLAAETLGAVGSRAADVVFSDKGGKVSASVSVQQSFEGYPRFAVMCDLHFGNHEGEGPMVKVPRALRHLLGKGQLDALFICGDLTDGGTAAQYADLRKVFADTTIVPEGLRVVFMQGDHDNYDANGQANYLSYTGQPLDQFLDIKGYPFITFSIRGRRGYDGYDDVERTYLERQLERAARLYPGKPIFVFTHVPTYGTVYGSCAGEGGWGTHLLADIVEKYPQVVLFSGHSHFPLSDPRSIHQGRFTSVNVGSSTYAEIEPDCVDEGIHPADYENVTEGLIVSADASANLTLQRWDTFRDEEILPRWQVCAPHDGTAFTYQNHTSGKAPWFAVTDSVSLDDVTETGCTVSFPRAMGEEPVHHYVVELCDADSAVVARQTCFSGYYLNSQRPVRFTLRFSGVSSETALAVSVTAIDAYGAASAPLRSRPFHTPVYTPDPTVKAPVADLIDLVWNSEGQCTDVSPQRNAVTTGTSRPSTAFSADYACYVPTFTGESQSFYSISYAGNATLQSAFQRAFSFETVYRPADTRNVCVMSAQESGGAGIEQASGGNIRFYAYVGGSYKVLKGTVDAEPGKAYHVVATYDAAAGKTCLYVNGKPAGEMEAVGTLTFPASTVAHWIAIGGDAAPGSYVQYALKGEVARARMYSHGLSRDEVSALYRQLTFPHPQANQQP